jgi:ferrochelatase
LRAGKTRSAYALIGGKSPINEITSAQAAALERELRESGTGKPDFRVFVGMRYWSPLIDDVVSEIYNEGVRRLIALSLYPHYSLATTGSSLSRLKRVLASYPDITVHAIESWYDHPLYINALVEQIQKGVQSFRSSSADVHVLFSAHSLPMKFIREGDPYADHIMATIRAVTAKTSISWSLSYQSKSGPVAWLEPSTETMLERLAARGVKDLLVVPISFVSDHIETLYEIDILYKDMAAALGIKLERTESLNLSPTFIAALKDIVIQGMKEAGWGK